MISQTTSVFTTRIFAALLMVSLLLCACAPAAQPPARVESAAPADTAAPLVVTAAPVVTFAAPDSGLPTVSLDAGSLASGNQAETVPAAFGGDMPYWEVLPEYTRVTLQGYPISDHLHEPGIYIYPLNGLKKVNQGAGTVADALESLLGSPREIADMPFLPLFNAGQMMHTHVQYLDFQSGQGLRYLTMFSQGIVPINNDELIYTYQGLTSDGKYYVAAVLPVTHTSLPADGGVTGSEPPEFVSDYAAYVANTAASLNTQAANTFTPDLTQLDAMMSSLEIK